MTIDVSEVVISDAGGTDIVSRLMHLHDAYGRLCELGQQIGNDRIISEYEEAAYDDKPKEVNENMLMKDMEELVEKEILRTKLVTMKLIIKMKQEEQKEKK